MSTEFPEIIEDDEDDQEIILTSNQFWSAVDRHIQENEYDDPIFYYMDEGEGSLFIDNKTLTKTSLCDDENPLAYFESESDAVFVATDSEKDASTLIERCSSCRLKKEYQAPSSSSGRSSDNDMKRFAFNFSEIMVILVLFK